MHFIKQRSSLLILLFIVILAAGCNDKKSTAETTPLFTLLTPDQTGVAFSNELSEGLNKHFDV